MRNVANIHNTIWETVTYTALGGPFKTEDIVTAIAEQCHLARKTASLYWNDWVRWALAHPDEFYGPVSRLRRIRFGLYELVDGTPHPEH